MTTTRALIEASTKLAERYEAQAWEIAKTIKQRKWSADSLARWQDDYSLSKTTAEHLRAQASFLAELETEREALHHGRPVACMVCGTRCQTNKEGWFCPVCEGPEGIEQRLPSDALSPDRERVARVIEPAMGAVVKAALDPAMTHVRMGVIADEARDKAVDAILALISAAPVLSGRGEVTLICSKCGEATRVPDHMLDALEQPTTGDIVELADIERARREPK